MKKARKNLSIGTNPSFSSFIHLEMIVNWSLRVKKKQKEAILIQPSFDIHRINFFFQKLLDHIKSAIENIGLKN